MNQWAITMRHVYATRPWLKPGDDMKAAEKAKFLLRNIQHLEEGWQQVQRVELSTSFKEIEPKLFDEVNLLLYRAQDAIRQRIWELEERGE